MTSNSPAKRAKRTHLRLEQLEARQLLSGYQPTAVEQLFLEELNDARANPAQYGNSIGVDLSGVAPSAPLAFNPLLIEAARLHSQDMNSRGYFAHNTPEGIDPGQRLTAVGFNWVDWGESIAGGSAYPGPSAALSGLIADAGVPDLGHRRQLLAIDATFQDQNQVGIGIVQAGTGPLVNYYTIDTAGTGTGAFFLTGSVFNDANLNTKYDIGEGLGGVTITVSGIGSTTTWASGGYTIQVAPGTYTVTASGGGLLTPLTRTITVGNVNARLNFAENDDSYVRKLYQVVLGRTPSAAEVNIWLNVLQGPMGAATVAAGIQLSAEARAREVRSWYVTYLGRTPANGEVQAWVNWMAATGASQEDVLAGILSSNEYYTRLAAGDGQYIATLYNQLLHRTASLQEINLWQTVIATQGRWAAARTILASQEYRSDQVAVYYSTLLHRTSPPSSAEVAAWVNSGLDLTSIRIGFESSLEFCMSS
jgi:uncharacterized protein YkwD